MPESFDKILRNKVNMLIIVSKIGYRLNRIVNAYKFG